MGILIVIIFIFIIISYSGSNNNYHSKTNSSNEYDSKANSNKYDTKVTSTGYINSKEVIYNGVESLEGNLNVNKVIVSDSVTSIRPFAFATCRNLKEIKIPSSVISIGNSAFAGCSSLKEIKIPNSITSIGEYAFAGCSSLREVKIPSSVTSIGKFLFKNCNDICIYCSKGSYAEKYAKLNEIPYTYNRKDANSQYIKNTNENSSKETNSEKLTNKNYEEENKIEFLSAQGIDIIKKIINSAYERFDIMDRNSFNYSMRADIFDKKLNRANGNKKLYAESLERNILYYFNLIEDINKYIVNCIKTKRFPSTSSEWQSKFTQLQNENKFTDVNKARNKERLDIYKSFNDIDKLISELEWDYTYFYINSWLLEYSIGVVSKNNDFVRPLFKELPNAVIKEFEKCCHIKTSIFLKSIKVILNENKQDLKPNNSKTFKEFYSSKTADQLKNDVDEVYYSKLKELNLKDASFGINGSKEFLGAIELALFDKNIKSYIDKGIENVFTRDWGALDFSNYMDEIVEKYSEITMDEWNESYIYFEKNHSWLDKHPCASQEIVMKRFEFLKERNQNIANNEDKKICYSPVFYSLKKIDERQKLQSLFSSEVTDSIFNDLLNLPEHVYGDFTFEEIIIGYYMTEKICDNYVPFGLFLALTISSKNYIKYENLESKSLEFKIHSFNNHINSSSDFFKYFNSVDIEDKLAFYINYLAIKSNNIDAYISQKCIENCINFNKFNIMDKYIEDSLNYYKFDNEYKRFCSREDFLEFKELIDLFETEFIKRNLRFNKIDINENEYMIEYTTQINITFEMQFSEKFSGIIFDTISVCSLYDKRTNFCNQKIIRTWRPDDFYEWFGYHDNYAFCGFGNGEIVIHDIKRYLSILNNNIISQIKYYF